MKAKRALSLLFLCLVPLFAKAQLRPTPPLIQYRQGNENLLDIRLSRSGVVLTPSSSLTISAEIRESEDTRVLLKLPFVRPDTSTRLRATLPSGLGSGIYKLGLLIQQTGYSDYRTGIANLKILASGSLESISASANLSVSILPQTAAPINITAESGPLLIAYYNQQAQAIRNHVDSVSVQVVASNGLALSNLYSFTQSQNQRDSQQDTQISNRVLTSTYTDNRLIDQNAISQKLAITDTTAFVRKRNGLDLSQNSYTNSEKTKLAGVAVGATNVTNTNQLVNGAGFLDASTGVPIGTYTANRIADLNLVNSKQNALTFDSTPTASSTNVVTSGAVKAALVLKLDFVQVATYADAVAIATGLTPKRIRVLSDINRGGYGNTYDYWPDSTAPDKLELSSL